MFVIYSLLFHITYLQGLLLVQINSPPDNYRDKRSLPAGVAGGGIRPKEDDGVVPLHIPLIYRLFCAPAGAQQPPFTCYISHVHAFLTHSFSCTPSPIRICFARHNYWVQSLFNNLARLLLASGCVGVTVFVYLEHSRET